MSILRGVLVILTCLSVAFAPHASIVHAKTADGPAPSFETPVLDPSQLVQAQSNIAESLTGMSKLPTTQALLNNKYIQRTRAVGSFVSQETLQLGSTIMVLAALVYKTAEDRSEIERLNRGPLTQTPISDPNAALCAQSEGVSVIQDTLCGGEFITGALMAAGVSLPQATVRIIAYLLSNLKVRSAFLKVAFGMFSMTLMMTLAQASSWLWTQAIKYLPEEKQNQAKGLAGRAVVAHFAGHKAEFAASADGQLLSEITGLMYKIVVLNDKFRDLWLFNVWRFGLGRGDFIASVGTLMAASTSAQMLKVVISTAGKAAVRSGTHLAAAGSVLAARGGALLGGTGTAVVWTAGLLGFVVATALGMVAFTYIMESHAPQALTNMIQGSRQWLHNSRMGFSNHFLGLLAERFHQSRYPGADNPEYIKKLQVVVDDLIQRRLQTRNDWMNIAIEQFYDLKMESEILLMKIRIAEKVIKEEDLQRNLYISKDGQILSYEEARRNVCTDSDASLPTLDVYVTLSRCEPPVELQLKKLTELKRLVSEAREQLRQISLQIVDYYDNDIKVVTSYTQNPEIVLPYPFARALSNYLRRASVMRQNFTSLLGIFDDKLAERWQLRFNFPSAQDRETAEVGVRRIWDAYYNYAFDEEEIYKVLAQRFRIEE